MHMNFRVLPSGLAVPANLATETARADGPIADDANNLDAEGVIPCLHPNRSNLQPASGHDSEHGTSAGAA